jgi:hypothetical protein
VRIAVYVAWGEHEASAQLKRILPELVLPEPTALGAFPRPSIVSPQQVKEIGRLKSSRMVGLPLFIDQQGECYSGFLAEHRRVTRIAQADGGHLSALGLELSLVLTQLRDMLTAENSAVMAKENNDGGVQLPQRAEAYRGAG